MRLDKYLKVSRIIKRRTIAKEACDHERVKLNGKIARASDTVKVGDRIQIEFGHRVFEYEILLVQEHAPKDQAREMYVLLGDGDKE